MPTSLWASFPVPLARRGKVDGALADVQMVINDVNGIIIDIREITGIDGVLFSPRSKSSWPSSRR